MLVGNAMRMAFCVWKDCSRGFFCVVKMAESKIVTGQLNYDDMKLCAQGAGCLQWLRLGSLKEID